MCLCLCFFKPIFLYFVVNNVRNDSHPVMMIKPRSTVSTCTQAAQNMINIGLKFAYINNSLANLEKQNTDIHDQAYFKNVNSVRHLDDMCDQYPRYTIANLAPLSPTLSESHHTSLNAWLRSIAEFLVVARRSNLQWCWSNPTPSSPPIPAVLSTNQPQSPVPPPSTPISCECLMRGVEQSEALKNCWLRSSVLIRFFLQAPLNGNFFKLKHLYAFLERTLENVTRSLATVEFTGPIESLGDEITRPLEFSAKSAYLLGEILRFLKTPCVYTVFKTALNDKRRSLVSSSDVVTTTTTAATTSGITNTTNNNDENFSNMNMNETRTLQIKSMTINSGGGTAVVVADSATAEIIHRSPLNGNY